MNSILYFMAAFVFKITASQNFSYSTLHGTEQSLTLRCVTVDLSKAILFTLGTDNKGGCIAGSICNTVIPGYETPTQPETTITEMVITSCNETRDIGSWTCTYGGSTSDPVMITTCPGVATTEEPSTTQHDVTTERLLTTTNDSTTTIQNTDIICTTPICFFLAALLFLIALLLIASLIVLLVLCCTGRVTCTFPHAFHKKNTSKTSNQNSNNKHQIYKGDGRTTSCQLGSDNQFMNTSYSVDDNGHQSKNKHVVTSDSSQSKKKHHPSIEYNIKNTKNPSTRDNRHVHNRGYY